MVLPVAETFPLFSAEGERQWVAGWDPRYASPTGSHAKEGLVFQTTKAVGTATWIQTRHEPAAGVASRTSWSIGPRPSSDTSWKVCH